jgi:crotonobetainyl-CoA:carnitine CoA-transferase CaiB-like acyl-CoA transferase
VYRCAGDDEWLAISVEHDDEWKALVTVVGPALEQAGWHALPARRRDHDRIDEVIAQWTSGRTKFDACRSLQAAGVRAFPVMTNRDLVEDPHLAARGYFVTLSHPDTGSLVYPGFPFRFERNAVTLTAAPGLGEDNDAILSELGWGDAARKDLEANGALATAPPS